MYKLLIVDDEAVIRKGLANLIEWSSIDCEVVGEAVNGIDAIEKMKIVSPHIIIADVKMPCLNGIELAKYVFENTPSTKVIILTGYADFEYAQSALKYNVVDFLLKPTDPNELINAVKKAKNIILQNETFESKLKDMEKKINLYQTNLRENNVNSILHNILNGSDKALERLPELGISLERNLVIICEVENKYSNFSSKDINGKDRIVSNIKNYINAIFKNYVYYLVHFQENQFCIIVSFADNCENKCMQSIIDICKEMLKTFENLMGLDVSIGISKIHLSHEELPDSYKEAQKALSYGFYEKHGNNLYVYSDETVNASNEKKLLANSYTERIILELQNGHKDALINLIEELFEKLRCTRQSIDYIKKVAMQLCFSFEEVLSDCDLNIEDCIQAENDIYEYITKSNKCVHITNMLVSLAVSILEKLHSLDIQNNLVIKKAQSYINEYYKDPITLQTIADYLYINSSYLSRLFKKETGYNITDYINKVRIDKAKDLLINSDYKIYEIADMVGISDPAYFSVLFKKYTNMSPRDFTYKYRFGGMNSKII